MKLIDYCYHFNDWIPIHVIDGTGAPNYYYESTYYPGASYVKDMYPELEDDHLISIPEMASYFPLTRYSIH